MTRSVPKKAVSEVNKGVNVSAVDVAKLFLYWANKDGDLITNLKMQKLLYYAQAWHLVNFKSPLFKEEIEAWSYGPVVPVAYRHFKDFKNGPIQVSVRASIEDSFTPKTKKYLEDVYEIFSKFSAHELVNMSHNEGPWMNHFDKNEAIHANIIPKEEMKSFYTKLYEAKKK